MSSAPTKGRVFIIFRLAPGSSRSFFDANMAFKGEPKALVITSSGRGKLSGRRSSEFLFITIAFDSPSLLMQFSKKAAFLSFLSTKKTFFLGI